MGKEDRGRDQTDPNRIRQWVRDRKCTLRHPIKESRPLQFPGPTWTTGKWLRSGRWIPSRRYATDHKGGIPVRGFRSRGRILPSKRQNPQTQKTGTKTCNMFNVDSSRARGCGRLRLLPRRRVPSEHRNSKHREKVGRLQHQPTTHG